MGITPYENLTLVVSSCDKYAVCWPPFCHGINKYWPDHPPLVFITNQLEAPCGVSLKIGQDKGWAANLLKALDFIPTDYILYAQEDYWIRNRVSNDLIQDYLQHLESDRADYIRLYPAPPPDLTWETDARLGAIAAHAPYRTSLQMALWRKKTLISLLNINETPWKFEVNGTQRSREYGERFLCVTNRKLGLDYVFSAIVNGYWSKAARIYAEQEGILIDFGALAKKTLFNRIKDGLHNYAFKVKKFTAKEIEKINEKFLPDR